MDNRIGQNLVVLFPLFFVALWLVVSKVLDSMSGWSRLARTYPDQPGEPILKLRFQSGMMGPGVAMQGILTLSACRTGLRVGMWRLFGPWSHDFLVPWDKIRAVRTQTFLVPLGKLQFGAPVVGSLSISINAAARLAAAAGRRWPEAVPPVAEPHAVTARRLLMQWAIATCLAAMFFTLAPRLAGPGGGPPIAVAILFPAIVFGVGSFVRYLLEKS